MSAIPTAALLVARAAVQMLIVTPKLSVAQARNGLVETATGEVELLQPVAAVAGAASWSRASEEADRSFAGPACDLPEAFDARPPKILVYPGKTRHPDAKLDALIAEGSTR